MELICDKYKEKVDPKDIRCHHPDDYCQHRQACIIHFMGKEAQRDSGGK